MADKIMKTLNGYEVYDEYARTQLNGLLSESDTAVPLSHLKNSKGGVLCWRWATGSDGSADYVLVPRSTLTGDEFDAYLGDSTTPWLGLYTGFVQASGVIQSTGGNITTTKNVVADGNVQGNNLVANANVTAKNVTVTGNIISDGTASNGGIIQAKKQVFSEGKLTANGDTALGGALSVSGATTVSARIQPYASQNVNLGLADKRWMNIYSNSQLNVSSDIRIKEDIEEIDERYIQLFDMIQPYSYKLVDGTSGRTHTGFLSQHVEEAMEKVGLTAKELAFFCKDPLYKEIKDEDGNVIGTEPVLDENGNQDYFYSLCYGEYIAIMAAKIKQLESKLDKVAELETRLAKLEA